MVRSVWFDKQYNPKIAVYFILLFSQELGSTHYDF